MDGRFFENLGISSALFTKSLEGQSIRDCYCDMMSLSTIIVPDTSEHFKKGEIVYMLDPHTYFHYKKIDRYFFFDMVHCFLKLGKLYGSMQKLKPEECVVINFYREIMVFPRSDVQEIRADQLDDFFLNYLNNERVFDKEDIEFLLLLKREQLASVCRTIRKVFNAQFSANRLNSNQWVYLNKISERLLIILIPLLIYFHCYYNASVPLELVTVGQLFEELGDIIKLYSRFELNVCERSPLSRILSMFEELPKRMIVDQTVELTRRRAATLEMLSVAHGETFSLRKTRDLYWSTHYPELVLDYIASDVWGRPEISKSCFIPYLIAEPSILLAFDDEQYYQGFIETLRLQPTFDQSKSDFWESLKNSKLSTTTEPEGLKKERDAVAKSFVKYFDNSKKFSCFKQAQRLATLMVFKFESETEGEACLIESNVQAVLDIKVPSSEACVDVVWQEWAKSNEKELSSIEGVQETIVPLHKALQLISNGNILRSYITFLLKAGNVKVLVELVNDCRDGPKVFMNTILSVYRETNIVNTGVVWFALLHCLSNSTALREVMKDSKTVKEIEDAFGKSLHCTVCLGTMKMYYTKMKTFFAKDQQRRIELKLTQRKNAELQFTNCFYWDIYTLPTPLKTEFSEFLKDKIEKWPYVWITVFHNRLRVLCRHNKAQEIQRCLQIFRQVLTNSSLMRKYFYKCGLNEHLKLDIFSNFEYKESDDIHKMIAELCDVSFIDFQSREIRGRAILGQFGTIQVEEIRLLAESGEATVILASVECYAFPVVAKYFKKELINHLTEELDLLMRLHCHPHIVHSYGYIVENEEFSGIIIEYCKGGSVRTYIETYPDSYTNETILFWIFQATSALSYLHTNGIFHRDLKPDNMLLLDEPTMKDEILQAPRHLKLTDFGVAKQFNRSKLTSKTVTCSVYGTPGFQAPESDDLEVFNTKLDIFSLGRSIWQLYYQKWPYDDVINNETSEPKINVPIKVEEIMNKMMIIEAQSRPDTEEVFQFFRNLNSQ